MSQNYALQAAERAHNFVDFYLQTTSTVSEVSRYRSPLRYYAVQSPTPDVTQMRCRTVAVHRRWKRSLWTKTTLADEAPWTSS